LQIAFTPFTISFSTTADIAHKSFGASSSLVRGLQQLGPQFLFEAHHFLSHRFLVELLQPNHLL